MKPRTANKESELLVLGELHLHLFYVRVASISRPATNKGESNETSFHITVNKNRGCFPWALIRLMLTDTPTIERMIAQEHFNYCRTTLSLGSLLHSFQSLLLGSICGPMGRVPSIVRSCSSLLTLSSGFRYYKKVHEKLDGMTRFLVHLKKNYW